jgi:1-aminocyclopropane-1-carboxylate deaminase
MLSYSRSPVQQLQAAIFERAGIHVIVKREDLNHSFVTGNKWWKLKYNLAQAQQENHKTLLTFGGAFSNHIYATAAAAHELGFKSIGIIRGEENTSLGKTLMFAREKGMQLHFVSRDDYRKKAEKNFTEVLHHQFGSFYLIPEGGTNELAIKGVEEFAKNLKSEIAFDYICCACGTGGTLAGLVKALPERKVIGFSSLKGDFLSKEMQKLIGFDYSNWNIQNTYHFGGYAKSTPELLLFIRSFEQEFGVPLEQVYTAKMFFGLFDLIQTGFFKRGSTILALHTGGLQGRLSNLSLPTSIF